jgi:hypothetical protein
MSGRPEQMARYVQRPPRSGRYGRFASYVELLICLEMARDAGNEKTNSRSRVGVQSTRPAPPEMSVVDKHE